KPIPIPIALKPAVIELIRERIRTGLYEPAASPYLSSWFAVEKKNGKIRIVHNLQKLNGVTIKDGGLPPNIAEHTDDCVGYACIGALDILGGYD
ncbi:DNA/RNA polymerase, partial [Atractiella rhizophila]